MSTRFDGTLKNWDADRGMGFVVADQGGEALSVHVSAFPRDRRVPAMGEALSFEIEVGRDGKKSAVRVQRRASPPPAQSRAHRHDPNHAARSTGRRYSDVDSSSSGVGSRLIGLVIVAVLGWYGYTQYTNRVAQIQPAPQTATASPVPVVRPAGFTCDGRQHCSQMTSCNEAKLFLKNCPGVQMDGDGDGVPCEQQWCTGAFGN
jgi:cold shock CspA family protein